MFQTEPIIFLQGIQGTVFHVFMLAVNELGRPAGAMLLAFVLISLDARKGFVLIQVLAVTAILTETLKRAVALPRPYFVDSNVRILDRPGDNTTTFTDMDAEGFFSPLPETVVDYHRALAGPHWGFPSGHVSSSIALWLVLWLIYRRQWLLVATAAFTIAVAVARLYLGKHFLADVLGGALLGASVSLLAWRVALCRTSVPPPADTHKRRTQRASLQFASLVLVPVVLLFLPVGESRWFAALLGLNLGYLTTRKFHIAQRNAGVAARLARMGIALAVLVPLAALAWYFDAASADPAGRAEAALVGCLCFVAMAAPARIAAGLRDLVPVLRQ
jgi:membrane-associated phospholipid phosphatase